MQRAGHNWVFALPLAASMGLTLAGVAVAQESGDARNGLAMAQQMCSECHAVLKGELASPHAQAPSFTSVANKPGLTGAALRVWFQTSHRSMPDLTIGEMEGDDLIAYIVSLKTRR